MSAFDADDDTKKENYTYNTAYSSSNIRVPYTSLPVDFTSVSKFPYMARWSELKVLGQRVDGMRKFLQLNFKNVDALHGELTAGLVGGDRLFYLQERGVGYFPVEEREMSGSSIGAPLQLGVGGIMDRADNVDRFYGCQHKLSVYHGNDHFGFFDFRRKAYLMMSFNGQVNDVSMIMGMDSFFNEVFKPVQDLSNNIFNTEDPINGCGIVGVFDSKHKMGLMTFKFKDDLDKPYDFTIGINSVLKAFVGFFSFVPPVYIEHNDKLFSGGFCDKPRLFPNTSYQEGDVVSGSGTVNFNYVCIESYTTGPPPVGAELDPAHWALVGSKSDGFKYWDGDICKFLGVTYPFELEVVFKGAVGDQTNDSIAEKVFDNIEVYGNDTALTDVYYADSKRTASDTNILPLNKNFAYINNAWWFNVALSNGKERMLDHYMKMKIVVKNYKQNATISLNKIKRVVYLKTIYRKKQ